MRYSEREVKDGEEEVGVLPAQVDPDIANELGKRLRVSAVDAAAEAAGHGAPAGVAELVASGPTSMPVAVPRLWLANDERMPRLEWRPEREREVDRDPEWLPLFVKLAEAEPVDIEAFARLRGILGVNRDGLPGLRDDTRPLTPLEWSWENEDRQRTRREDFARAGSVLDHFWEPIDAWRTYARGFRAILRIAFDLQEGRGPTDADFVESFQLLRQPDSGEGWNFPAGPASEQRVRLLMDGWRPRSRPSPVARSQYILGKVVAMLLDELRPSLRLSLNFPGPERLLVVTPGNLKQSTRDEQWAPFLAPESGLYFTLAVQLLAAITSPLGLVRCSYCNNPYAPSAGRAPRADRRQFCSNDCRVSAKKEADRATSQRRYQRRREGVE